MAFGASKVGDSSCMPEILTLNCQFKLAAVTIPWANQGQICLNSMPTTTIAAKLDPYRRGKVSSTQITAGSRGPRLIQALKPTPRTGGGVPYITSAVMVGKRPLDFETPLDFVPPPFPVAPAFPASLSVTFPSLSYLLRPSLVRSTRHHKEAYDAKISFRRSLVGGGEREMILRKALKMPDIGLIKATCTFKALRFKELETDFELAKEEHRSRSRRQELPMRKKTLATFVPDILCLDLPCGELRLNLASFEFDPGRRVNINAMNIVWAFNFTKDTNAAGNPIELDTFDLRIAQKAEIIEREFFEAADTFSKYEFGLSQEDQEFVDQSRVHARH
ncbi:hypothetical protein B0H19DRAFT_1068176 [Mycena capillaripes]|nr:hypothetical protein B0H19DRAFT_1068176 [Mycena capillaripes]